MSFFIQPISEEIFNKKYKLHGEKNVEEVFKEIAKEIANTEEEEKEFYTEMIEGRFIPAGRFLANARPNSKLKNYLNCFVIGIEDSMDSITKTLTEYMQILKIGGGCVAKGSKVLERSKGIINIEDVKKGDSVYSFNTILQQKEFKKVLQTHTPFVEKNKQIEIVLENNTRLITSLEHPTLVYRDGEFKYVKACNVSKEDLFLNFTNKDVKRSECVDTINFGNEEIAWLIGAHLGDGSADYKGFGKKRISGDNEDVIKKYSEIYNKQTNSTLQKGYNCEVCGISASSCSSETYSMYIPQWIFNSSERIQYSFIAGLIDTDGYINEKKVFYYTSSQKMKNDFLLLLNLLNVRFVNVREKKARNYSNRQEGKVKDGFEISIKNVSFMKQIKDFLAHKTKKEKIEAIIKNRKNKGEKIILIKELLSCIQENFGDNSLYNHLDKINSLVNKDTLIEIIEGGYNNISSIEKMKLSYLLKLSESLVRIKSIDNSPNYDENFYDLTVEDNNNYFSGIQGLSVIHNTGLNISSLRPKNSEVSTGGVSSGPLSFLEIFDQASKTIEVGGSRRGASICVMNVEHPDIEEFITFKQGDNNKKLTQFNISVGITREFMQAVKNDSSWDLKFNGKVYKTIKAKELYNKIIKNAYQYNEPGIFNLDAVNTYNNGFYMYDIDSPNACGELPMPQNSVCCLSALNLTGFVRNEFEENAYFDWNEFKKTIKIGVHFLDNALDRTTFPLKKIEERSLGDRRIGLGITGFGDMLSMLRKAYGSEESKIFADKLFSILRNESYLESIELARQKGSFPNFSKEILESPFIKNLPKNIQEQIKNDGLRNITLNTIAPVGTGSFSIGNNCSSGIEPAFSLEYNRTVRNPDETKTTQKVYDYAWLRYKEKFNDDKAPNYFKTALEIDPYDSIDIQAIAQKYTDNGISKTINLPENFSIEQYKDLYMYAYDNKVKGVTSFRLGTMEGILDSSNKKNDGRPPEIIKRVFAPKRPQSLPCDIHEIIVNKERHIVLVGKLYGALYEIFVTNDPENKIEKIGKKTGSIIKQKRGHYSLHVSNGEDTVVFDNIAKSFDPTYASLSRFISMSLRHGVPLQFIVDQLQKDSNFIGFERTVARIIKKYIKEGEKVLTDKCEDCGGELIFKEGCITCMDCGWSKCG